MEKIGKEVKEPEVPAIVLPLPQPEEKRKAPRSQKWNVVKMVSNLALNTYTTLKSRRATYPYQSIENGELDGVICFFYSAPAFARNPLLLLIRYGLE